MIIDTDKLRDLIKVNKAFSGQPGSERAITLMENSIQLVESVAQTIDAVLPNEPIESHSDSMKTIFSMVEPVFTADEIRLAKEFSSKSH